MTRNEARTSSRARMGEYLRDLGVDVRAAKGNGCRCPICGGEGFRYVPRRGWWDCRSCGGQGDVYSLWGAINGTKVYRFQEDGVFAALGLKVEEEKL